MIVYRCDLCSEIKPCRQRRIEGDEYDICADCWAPLWEKLKGRGRSAQQRQAVFVPPPESERPGEEHPAPERPPQIWYDTDLRKNVPAGPGRLKAPRGADF